MQYLGWDPPSPQSVLARTALLLGAASIGLLCFSGLGWALDVLVAPLAFAVSLVAVVKSRRRPADRGFAIGGLLMAVPSSALVLFAAYAVLTDPALAN
ncbi:hypothetical protein [Catenulispora subtropica]